MTEKTWCVYCGRPTKGRRACSGHTDLEKAELELRGDDRRSRSSVAPPANVGHDDGPIDPLGGRS